MNGKEKDMWHNFFSVFLQIKVLLWQHCKMTSLLNMYFAALIVLDSGFYLGIHFISGFYLSKESQLDKKSVSCSLDLYLKQKEKLDFIISFIIIH